MCHVTSSVYCAELVVCLNRVEFRLSRGEIPWELNVRCGTVRRAEQEITVVRVRNTTTMDFAMRRHGVIGYDEDKTKTEMK